MKPAALLPLLLLWMLGGVFVMTRNWLPPISSFIRAHRFFWFFTPPGVRIVSTRSTVVKNRSRNSRSNPTTIVSSLIPSGRPQYQYVRWPLTGWRIPSGTPSSSIAPASL